MTAAVRAFPPYRGPETVADFPPNGPRMRFLHLNECPYPPSPKVVEAVRAAAESIVRYPDIYGHALAAKLSARTGVPAGRIVFGCGSDELIHLVCELSVAAGDRAVMPAPAFPRYAISSRILGAEPVQVPLLPNGACDADGLLAAIDDRTRIVFACTPNAPSGGMMDAAALERLAAAVPEHVLLAVDEAYHEFGRHAGGPEVLPILARRRGPWVVFRTFSKAYGLGGVRVGYALCGQDEVAEAFRRIKLQFNVTTLGYAAAEAALEDEAHLLEVLEATAQERTRLSEGFSRLGLAPCPSAANFVSAEVPFAATLAMDGLRQRGILIRDWRHPAYPNHIRVTLGLPEDTDAVLAGLTEILREQRGR